VDWYEDEVRGLERRLAENPPPDGVVAFYGSSSVRMWDSLADDFPDLPVVNLGFGGSTLAACAHFHDRLVGPLSPRSLLIYAGDNDLGDGHSPEDVLASLRDLLAGVDRRHPGLRVGVLSLKPSPARWHLADRFREASALLRSEIEARSGGFWLEVFGPMLGADGQPRRELFADDGLHLSVAGYRLWADLVSRHRPQFA